MRVPLGSSSGRRADPLARIEDLQQIAIAGIDNEQAATASRKYQIMPQRHGGGEIACLRQPLPPQDLTVGGDGMQTIARRREVQTPPDQAERAGAFDGQPPADRPVLGVESVHAARIRRRIHRIAVDDGSGVNVHELVRHRRQGIAPSSPLRKPPAAPPDCHPRTPPGAATRAAGELRSREW